ncbi:DoxX family protein [Rhizobium sp. SG_E_25_P2]|uniref:DoxX family protein n=1 Tax=Rhizobium sp. SG_E_25_P2 TaxID=2879942 RepID=UPI0024754662|nr:DoxX family protein [Rhizobium sp. SG_E_25_P2]
MRQSRVKSFFEEDLSFLDRACGRLIDPRQGNCGRARYSPVQPDHPDPASTVSTIDFNTAPEAQRALRRQLIQEAIMTLQTSYSPIPAQPAARETRFILPFMRNVYSDFAEPFAWTAFRIAIGGMLMIEGWPKIVAPLAQSGFVEGLGFYPGWLWSPVLAAMQFFGGLLIALGLLTRPLALANAVMLAITLWFHYSHPYGHAFLTQAGLDIVNAGGNGLFTAEGLQRLGDGGTKFLEQVQTKAELASLFWTGGAFLFAAFGGGRLSLDRFIGREF